MEHNNTAIAVEHISKSYKKTNVLHDVSFTVKKGTVFALLGSNGAGKTTLINILTTLIKADGGTASVANHDIARQADGVRNRISLTGQFAAVDDMLTARENLILIGELRHVDNPKRVADMLLDQFELSDAADRRALTFSGGMRRRLDIAMGLIGDPEVIFLDEPSTGLDPQSRNTMWQTIRGLAANGTTVFLTTQYLEEADQLADQIAVLGHGRIVAQGTAKELKELVPSGQVELRFHNDVQLQTAERHLAGHQLLRNDDHRTLTITTDGSVTQISRLFKELESAHIEIAEFSQKVPTLDDAFLKIIEENKGANNALVS
jgi:ABC-2 type transport system ATP-binding protein